MNAPSPNDLPLAGIRVIDFTQVMLGPVCTQMLGDYGADVIKIERKGAGDLSRGTFEPVAGHDNPVFCSLNRNKRSVALDLKSPEHLAAVRALIANADVVVNNFRAGVMERIGLGYDECRRMNPRIIYAVGTGIRRNRALFAQGRPGRARAGDERRHGAQGGRSVAAVHLSDHVRRLFGGHASGPGDSARADAAGPHRRRAEGQRGALQLDARRADAGIGDDHDGRFGDQLGGDAADRRVRDAGRRGGRRRRVQGEPAARHLRRAGDSGHVGRPAVRDAAGADQAQARAARDVPRAVQDEHDRALARAAGSAGPSVRAGAQPARSAHRSADDPQRNGAGRPRRRAGDASRRQSDPHVECAGRHAAHAAAAGRAHRRSAGRGALAARGERTRRDEQRRLRGPRSRRARDAQPAGGDERRRPRDGTGAAADLGGRRSRPRRPRRSC